MATDASSESEYAGSLLAGHGEKTRATALAIVVTLQPDIELQHRS